MSRADTGRLVRCRLTPEAERALARTDDAAAVEWRAAFGLLLRATDLARELAEINAWPMVCACRDSGERWLDCSLRLRPDPDRMVTFPGGARIQAELARPAAVVLFGPEAASAGADGVIEIRVPVSAYSHIP